MLDNYLFRDIQYIQNEIVNKAMETTELTLQTTPRTSIENAIKSVFPEKEEERKIAKTRSTLGEVGTKLSAEQIECINSEFQFLAETWLDEFEKGVFEGKTLKEILNEE